MKTLFTAENIALVTSACIALIGAMSELKDIPNIIKIVSTWVLALGFAAFIFYFPTAFDGWVKFGLTIGMGITGGIAVLNKTASKVGTAAPLTKEESK